MGVTSSVDKSVGRSSGKFTALRAIICASFCILFTWTSMTSAAVLPDERADVLYHRYDGDGSIFHGPSVLVRKNIKNTVSVWGNYYVDINSAASIDVVTQGSEYEEERVETSLGVDYLHNKTLLSASATNSSENDYEADSYALSVSQDFFGDLSTLTMSYANGKDDVYQNIRVGPGKDDIVGRTFFGNATHKRFAVGWTQILTKNWITSLAAEASIDEGYLQNPYRSYRYIGGRAQEEYPTTRNSEAYALKSLYYLPWRASAKLEYRVFRDSWGIKASNYEIKYTHPFDKDWIFDIRYRFYDQSKADFYQDIFNFRGEFTQLGNDKELSTFHNTAIGVGVTYQLPNNWFDWIDKTTVNMNVDVITYEYEDFLDRRQSHGPLFDGGIAPFDIGSEPAFSYDATVLRLFVSFWY